MYIFYLLNLDILTHLSKAINKISCQLTQMLMRVRSPGVKLGVQFVIFAL